MPISGGATGRVSPVKRRLTLSIGALLAAATLSSCGAAGTSDVVATVDGHELTVDQLEALAASTAGTDVRSALTAWTQIAAVSDDIGEVNSTADLDAARDRALDALLAEVGAKGRADYEQGLAGSPYLCLAAITLGTETLGADVVAELQAGTTFAEAAEKYSTTAVLASSGGVLANSSGATCLDTATFEQSFPGIITVLNDAQATVGSPVVVSDASGELVLLLRGWDDLTTDEQRVLSQLELGEALTGQIDEADVSIHPRYGLWDRETRSVVATSEG